MMASGRTLEIGPTNTWVVPFVCLLATGSLIGLSANLAKLAAEAGLGALPFLAWSVAGAAVVLMIVALRARKLPTLTARTTEYFVVAALLGVVVPHLLLYAAVPHVGAGFVALAIAFPPLFTYAGALAMRMERFNALRALGVLLALSGAALLAILKLSAPDAAAVWIAATLFAPVVLAAGNIYRTLRWPAGAQPDELAPGMVAASGLILLLAGAIPGVSLAVPVESAIPVLLILAQAAAFSVQFLLFFVLQKRGGPVYLSLLGSVAAVVGVPIAVLLLGEAPPQGLLYGAVLIALGIGFVTRGGQRQRKAGAGTDG